MCGAPLRFWKLSPDRPAGYAGEMVDRENLRLQRDAYRERATECVRLALLTESGSPIRHLACTVGLRWADRVEDLSRLLGESPDVS
jgi:hypothetical protein